MAQKRPYETLYSINRHREARYENAPCVGRACSINGALRGALLKLRERNYPRADIYDETGRLLYTITRTADAILVMRKKGERL